MTHFTNSTYDVFFTTTCTGKAFVIFGLDYHTVSSVYGHTRYDHYPINIDSSLTAMDMIHSFIKQARSCTGLKHNDRLTIKAFEHKGQLMPDIELKKDIFGDIEIMALPDSRPVSNLSIALNGVVA